MIFDRFSDVFGLFLSKWKNDVEKSQYYDENYSDRACHSDKNHDLL